MNTLTHNDLQWALIRTPKQLLKVMKRPEWSGKIFVGGGFLRSTVSGEPVNDVDVFVSSPEDALKLAREIVGGRLGLQWGDDDNLLYSEVQQQINRHIHHTDNALTLLGLTTTIQIIHRWVFNSGVSVADSFDFTCCCACYWWAGSAVGWRSYCDERFYPDVAAKRLVYRSPVRNEDAGGSMLRVLKYYHKGYRMPLDSLGAVIARLAMGCRESWLTADERGLAQVITGLLREVDPLIDPSHAAHLPAENANDTLQDSSEV
jgi:hypothetical protein